MHRTDQVVEKRLLHHESARPVLSHSKEEYHHGSTLEARSEPLYEQLSDEAPEPLERVCLEENLEVTQLAVSLRLPRDTWEAINLAAVGENLSRQQLIIRLLEHGLSCMPHSLKSVDEPRLVD